MMQLDTATAKTIMRAAEQSNAIAGEATRRVVELMQQDREHRDRIAALENIITKAHNALTSPYANDAERIEAATKLLFI